MNSQARFTKTDKGREEIQNRTHKLQPRQRTLLVIVDGRRPAGELLKTAESLGGGVELLEGLLEGGFIAEVSAEAAAPAQPAPAPAAEVSAEDRDRIYAAKAAMRRYIKLAAIDLRALNNLVDEVRTPDDVLRVLGEIRTRFEAAGYGEAFSNLRKELSGKG